MATIKILIYNLLLPKLIREAFAFKKIIAVIISSNDKNLEYFIK